MSRHRNIRKLNADEEYDDYYSNYDRSFEEDACISPETEKQFFYDRQAQKSTLSAFIDEGEETTDCNDNGKSYDSKNKSLSPLDSAKLNSCVEEMQNVVGDTIPESVLKKAAVDANFNLEVALDMVLKENVPKPQRVRKPKSDTYGALENVSSAKNGISEVCPSDITFSTAFIVKHEQKEKVQKRKGKSKKGKKAVDSDRKSEVDCALSLEEQPQQNRAHNQPLLSHCDSSLHKEIKDAPESSFVFDKNQEGASIQEDKKNIVEGEDASAKDVYKATSSKSRKSARNISEIYSKERGTTKPLINLVVIGHVDAGKSTLMGHLLYSLGQVSKKVMHKYEQESRKLGKASFKYAWVLDETPEERDRGITMDIAKSRFETENRIVVLLDAPGHKDFIPNMITGAAQADVAVLVLDATKGEFETGFEAGGQTREHTMLIRSLGVTQIAVAVNKMDNVQWDETRYKEILSKMSGFLKQVGFKESDITFVPCSGLTGENIIACNTPELKKWYNSHTLVEVIDSFISPQRPVDKPFRMCINDVFKGTTGGICVSGKIESGFTTQCSKVLVMPSGELAIIKGLNTDGTSEQHCFAGDQVVIQLSGIDLNHLAFGNIICDPSFPVKVTSHFEARLVVFDLKVPITKGFPVIIYYQSLSEQGIITNMLSQLNRSTGEVIKKNPRFLPKNCSAIVELQLSRPICIELFKDFKDLGRFMLRSGDITIAAGLVAKIL